MLKVSGDVHLLCSIIINASLKIRTGTIIIYELKHNEYYRMNPLF